MLVAKVFDLMIPTDFFAFHTLEILKTVSCFAGPKVMHFHVNMKSMTFWPWYHKKSCPTNEPLCDFFAFHALKITKNIRNSLIFLRKMATFSCFAVLIVIKMYASIHFMTICPLAHNNAMVQKWKENPLYECTVTKTWIDRAFVQWWIIAF